MSRPPDATRFITLEDSTQVKATYNAARKIYEARCPRCFSTVQLTKNANPYTLEKHKGSRQCNKAFRKLDTLREQGEASSAHAALFSQGLQQSEVSVSHIKPINLNNNHTVSSIPPLAPRLCRILYRYIRHQPLMITSQFLYPLRCRSKEFLIFPHLPIQFLHSHLREAPILYPTTSTMTRIYHHSVYPIRVHCLRVCGSSRKLFLTISRLHWALC